MKRDPMIIGAVAVIVIMILSGTLVLMGGSDDDPGWNEPTSMYVTDMLGRNVTVSTNITRVVATNPGALRYMVYMDAVDMVVGVENGNQVSSSLTGATYELAYPDLPTRDTIGPTFGGDPELIMSVNPQVLFDTQRSAGDCNALASTLGIPVISLNCVMDMTTSANYSNFCQAMRLIGQVLNKGERAEELISYIDSVRSDIESRVANTTASTRTAYIGGLSSRGSHGLDYTASNYAPFIYSDVENVVTPEMTSHASSAKQISLEILPSLNPDVLFVDAGGLALCKQNYADNPSLYDGITAFQTGEIYLLMPFNYYSANYDTLLADCYYVASIMYPDAFTDVNILEKADEIYTAFLGVPVYSLVASGYFGGFQQLGSLE